MKKLVLFSAIVFGLVFYSCSSDDDNVTEDNVSLVGDWRLTNVDFTDMQEGGIPASDACIVELIAGYEFHEDSSFSFILGEIDSPINFDGEYWTWEGVIDDFKIVQTNPMSPPYNFGLNPTGISVNKVDGKTTMTFNADMSNGSAAKFTLVKENIDKTKLPVLTKPDGSAYHCGFFD
ncbi:hypothetical protein [Aequorivita capsosiphonis]|uniref:hypothetical protein n=1 Tax=Aequorivita capsosiphonis TaxID=487317 RepID=UPI00041B06FC|nr:hypothetical protein [Aequorivita capsosiphonis]